MTEKELKEFDFNTEEIDKLRKDAHNKFLIYSDAQRKLDALISAQYTLFRKMVNKS